MRDRIQKEAPPRALRSRLCAALILAVLLCPGSGRAKEPAAPATEEVWLQSNLRELYPGGAEICLATYHQMSDTPGVVLVLETDVERFSHYRYTLQRDSLPPGAPKENRSGAIPVYFDPGKRRPQRIATVIEAVSKSGRRSRAFTVEIGYNPAEVYAAAGQRAPSWLVVQASDLVLCSGSVQDWIIEAPSADDRAFARRRWGRAVSGLDSDSDRARAIARALITTLRPHDGIPSGAMQYAPSFEQLARAESGQDHVWCGNYADIFSAACNALDIPARKIDMQYVWSSRGRTAFEIGEGHRTTEVFDRGLRRWIWLDLTFGYLGARDDHDWLSMADLVQALNDPRRLARLKVVEYDHENGADRIVPIAESRRGRELSRFFRQDQRYKYVRKAAATARSTSR